MFLVSYTLKSLSLKDAVVIRNEIEAGRRKAVHWTMGAGNENESNAANPVIKNAGTIKFPDSGWHSVTIPIKITYGQKEDIYK